MVSARKRTGNGVWNGTMNLALIDATTTNDAESKIRLIIDTVPALIWSARPDGSLDFISQRWLDYTGMTLEQMLERDWGTQCHPDDNDQLRSKWQAALTEGTRQPVPTKPKRGRGLSETFVAQKKEMIEAALRESGGRVSGPAGAAARLGMPGSTLESQIRSLKINKNRFKTAEPSTSRT